MKTKWRRYEVTVPVRLNDGRRVPDDWLGEAALELTARFSGASLDIQGTKGFWIHRGVLYRDDHARVVVDMRDTTANRNWMRQFKERWKAKLDQLELWMISYRIELD